MELTEGKKCYFIRPLGVTIFSLVWIMAIPFLPLSEKVASLILRFAMISFTIGSVVFIYHLVDIISLYFEKLASKTDNKLDDILVPFLRKTVKFLVILLGAVFIGDSFTIDMKNMLTGLGIGGIAFALAAKDSISNVLGSFTVLVDRPFHIGDWVVINENVEGTVEEVGLRSTRIRTFYDSLVTIPNGNITNCNIDNYGGRKFRRMNIKLGVTYATPPEKIEAFCEAIRQLILSHPYTRKDYFHVYLNHFSSSSLDILLYVFWEVPNWATELTERHRLLIDILRVAKEIDVDFAFPTQTLHLFKEEHTTKGDVTGEIYRFGQEKAKKIVQGPITMDRPRSGLASQGGQGGGQEEGHGPGI